ncbi:ankyrin repeat domain-containing protein [Cellvibrio mixtus]|uniref:ankyrin repeat domain-containing protein n=1 Tax=Cellvibrio mixtus TaxID=39650 RepID=UPI0005870FC0|nr:ankyrin repeat domain-containing protein [Cellvibrio mixtus]
MTEYSYTISIENAHRTIETLHNQLSEQHVKIKKSVLKEVISSLLGFDTSNVFDSKIKKYKERQEAQCAFDHRGHHKDVRDLVLKSIKNPLKLYDYFKKYTGFTTFIKFYEDFEVTGGYRFKENDVLFAKDKYSAIKTALNWDAVTQIEFKHWKDEDFDDLQDQDGGYWLLTFIGDGDEQYLGSFGENYLCSSRDQYAYMNSPDIPLEKITEFFIDEMMRGETPFFLDNRENFDLYLRECISENYGESFSATTENEYVKHIEKFLPYLGIDEIVSMEVGDAPLAFLKILNNYGACFDAPALLDNALAAGDLDVCYYLLGQGSSIKNLFARRSKHSDVSYFHDRISWFYCIYSADAIEKEKLFEDTKKYYRTAKKLGIPIDSLDNDGCSLLHHAAGYGFGGLYEFFISLGADATLKNKEGKTPEVIAQAADKEIAESESKFESIFDQIFKKHD